MLKRIIAWFLIGLALLYLLALVLVVLAVVAVPLGALFGGGVLWWKTRRGRA